MFVSIRGGSYERFRRSLSTGNPTIVRAAAAELPRLTLADQMRVTLLLLRREPASYDRAAARWLGNLALEVRGIGLGELEIALGALSSLREGHREIGLDALAALAEARGLDDLARALGET